MSVLEPKVTILKGSQLHIASHFMQMTYFLGLAVVWSAT